MAVPSSSPLASSKASFHKKRKGQESTEATEHQAKQNSNPSVRVIGGRIYCPVNGKTCHQCRQKTMDFVASCTNMKNPKSSKQCTFNFCQKCLWNRYGEKAEEVAKLDSWSCPKCRGICNCSFCMKRKGYQPTGIMVHTAKKTGFSSVSEMLCSGTLESNMIVEDAKKAPKQAVASKKFCSGGFGKLEYDKIEDDTKKKTKKAVASKKVCSGGSGDLENNKIVEDTKKPSKKAVASKKKAIAITPSKLGKENSLGRMVVMGLFQQVDAKSPKKTPKRRKTEDLKDMCNGNKVDKSPLKSLENLEQKPGIKMNQKEKDECPRKEKTKRKLNISSIPAKEKDSDSARPNGNSSEAAAVEVPLPQGIPLTTVAGVELTAEAVGEALQFLEFCATFGKVLDMRKGDAEFILRELLSTRRRRHGQPPSPIVRLNIQLLTIILEDLGEEASSLEGKDSWLKALQKFTSEYEVASSEFPSECFTDGYENLDISKKLRLVNFLCDEVLSTEHFRNWMEEQNAKYIENDKESKETLLAAKNKEKLLKQKMKNEIAEAVIAKNGAPLLISEHDAIVSQAKQEIAQAQAELLQITDNASKKWLRNDALRIEPFFVDTNGRAFWKLKTCGWKKNCNDESHILLQDFGTCDSAKSNENWFSYGAEKNGEVDAYISTLMLRTKISQTKAYHHWASTLEQQGNLKA